MHETCKNNNQKSSKQYYLDLKVHRPSLRNNIKKTRLSAQQLCSL
jgi:hypothetical protein